MGLGHDSFPTWLVSKSRKKPSIGRGERPWLQQVASASGKVTDAHYA